MGVRMIKKIIGSAIALVLTFTFVIKLSISEERIMLCTLGSNILFLDDRSCYSYFSFFGISDELQQIVKEEYGISAILSANTKTRFNLADELINLGIDINSSNPADGLNIPPLHSTIVQDDLIAFDWLLTNGADAHITYHETGENAFEFLNNTYAKKPTANREKMLVFFE